MPTPYTPYKPYLKKYAQINRKTMTKSEGLVRHCILKGDKTGVRRVRQKPIGKYILDFYCAKLKHCIEIDGSSHHEKGESDMSRDDLLRKTYHIKTFRYTSEQVEKNLQAVCDDINARCTSG